MRENTGFWKKAIEKLGIDSLTEMQRKALEISRIHNEIIILSPTGSGKTLSFLLPVLESIDPDCKSVQVLIITPSRELAQQIEKVFRSLGSDFKVNACFGGHSKRIEINNFSTPPAVLIGTPGRIADHIRSESFLTNSIKILILDEFDKSLELGFHTEMSFIISHLPNLQKRILSSATNLKDIPDFTGMRKPYILNYLLEENKPNGLTINVIKSFNNDKLDSLVNLLCNIEPSATLIFCNHREAVERISNHLKQSGIINDFFHGGLEQSERERMLVRFRNGSSNILITTDLASRGLDIPDISYIIHYQLPVNEDSFIHRNGRTARMLSTGTSFLILSVEESLPSFIKSGYHDFRPEANKPVPSLPDWQTLYIGGGKKDKINKMDIVGFLLKQGGLVKDDLGYIEVKDHSSYAAVKRDLIQNLLRKIKNMKIKNKKVKIEISY